ncbi:membrane-associated phospholipid phosphatase [Variovorax sp. TBS-050B]|uniref:phosphatase PAP2 family protein n=1 Tax=Variovorax sp. TBS-050B TaxID=2940551 RepID=UPI002474A914|nr:phosphatase PAP2 family protein [Variovorax sp. TBS-050B]MDH6593076.1 membrane-associated phospholipid phosphatase [Variovorax sp. TBS-050B]
MNNFWFIVTAFGDSGFLLPAALWIAIWLGSDGGTRSAAAHWVLLFGGCGLIVMLSKLAFLGWGIGSARFDFTGFSGHTALATALWPVAFWLAAQRWVPSLRLAAVAAGSVWAVFVGASRLALEVHSTAEVVTGAFLGLAASASFLWLHRARSIPAPPPRWLAMGLAVPLVFFLVGRPAPTQGALEALAAWMAGIERPYTRLDLRQGRGAPAESAE